MGGVMTKDYHGTWYPTIKEIDQESSLELRTTKRVGELRVAWFVALLFTAMVLALIVLFTSVPWLQTSFGYGNVVAYHPNDRLQKVAAPTKGFISHWYVVEGSRVAKGQSLLEIRDVDPDYMVRLEAQLTAAKTAVQAMEVALATSKLNVDRQKELSSSGLKSTRDYELSRLEYNKFLSDLSVKQKELTEIETKLARQAAQVVTAPRDGIVMRIYHPQGGALIKMGEELATLAPDIEESAVELYVDGNDMPLMAPGRKVRLSFEGWPAIQFSGWPSVAVGTFGGEIKSIDPGGSGKGQFRILVTPDNYEGAWPGPQFLRQGVKVKGWVLLNQVSLGYEVWRRLNNFPPSLEIAEDVDRKGLAGSLGKGFKAAGKAG
jgi:multidrug resistance efflux pump